MITSTRILRAVVAAASLSAAGPPAHAADHTNLEDGLPVTIEDAYPIRQGAIEVQAYGQFDRTHKDRRGPNRFTMVPRIEYGAFQNFQLSVEAPYMLGNASMTDQGSFRAKGLYNFNSEDLWMPALSGAVGVIQPYGSGAGGTETELKFIATKSIGTIDPYGSSPYSYVPRSLHFNASWFHNYSPLKGLNPERRDRYRIGVGYSQPITNDLVAVADIFRETDRDKGKATNLAELGGRYQLDPQTVISAAAGVGFGRDRSEKFRAVVGLQHTLSFPYRFSPPD